MPLLCVLGILVVWGCYSIYIAGSNTPAIKDVEKFQRETIGMSKKEIRKELKSGRWKD